MARSFILPARLDWWLAASLVPTSALLILFGVMAPPDWLAIADGAMRNPYYTGPLSVIFLLWGESTARMLAPRPARAFRLLGLAAVALLSGWFYATLPTQATELWISRLYLAVALGLLAAMPAAAVFLPAAGLLPARRLGGMTLRWAGVFAPFLIFIISASFGLALVSKLRPTVADPVMLRMDESLGFHAAVFFGSLHYAGSALWDAQYVVYAGLGALVMAVAGRFYLQGDRFALRRCLLAYVLAGFLGWLGYWQFPVVGPYHAWPELFRPASPEALAASLHSALTQATPLAEPAEMLRDSVPSLHAAWALMALIAAWKHSRRFFLAVLPVGVLSITTTLTLCMHYTSDLIAAAPFALFCWWLADGLARRSTDANAAAPLVLQSDRRRRTTVIFLGLELLGLAMWYGWSRHAPLAAWIVWPGILLITGGTAAAAARLGAEIRPAK